jgi:hypothetical protein
MIDNEYLARNQETSVSIQRESEVMRSRVHHDKAVSSTEIFSKGYKRYSTNTYCKCAADASLSKSDNVFMEHTFWSEKSVCDDYFWFLFATVYS